MPSEHSGGGGVPQLKGGLVGDITANLPSLSQLADDDDSHHGSFSFHPVASPAHPAASRRSLDTGGITAALPQLSELVREEEDATVEMEMTGDVPTFKVPYKGGSRQQLA